MKFKRIKGAGFRCHVEGEMKKEMKKRNEKEKR
jgi:hypothetical protein